MLFLDGVYVQDPNGEYGFRRTSPPSVELLHDLLFLISQRVARFLERRGILERDEDNNYLTLDGLEEDPLQDIHSHSVTYRVALGPQKGRKVFCLQTVPPKPEPAADHARVANLNGFSLHAGVAARADQRDKIERLCRYIARPAISEQRLSLTHSGKVRYRAEDTVSQRDHPCHLRATGFHSETGRPGAKTQSEPDPIPWRVRAQQQTPGRHHSVRAGQTR